MRYPKHEANNGTRYQKKVVDAVLSTPVPVGRASDSERETKSFFARLWKRLSKANRL